MPTTSDEQDRARKILDSAREDITDRLNLDALLIIGTFRAENGSTCTVQSSDGNWFAQSGLIAHLFHMRHGQALEEGRDKHRRESDAEERGEFDDPGA